MAKLSAQVIKAAGSDERVELADEPVHADQTWVSSYEIDPFDVPDEEKAALLADVERPAARGRRGRPRRRLAAHRAREQVLRRHGGHRHHPAAGAAAPAAHRGRRRRVDRRVRLDAHHRAAGRAAAGSTSRAPAGTGTPSSTEIPELLAEKMRAPSVEAGLLRPGRRPVQPVADHPRVHRPRHRAGPGPRLRGGLRGHLLRHLRPARQAQVRLAS